MAQPRFERFKNEEDEVSIAVAKNKERDDQTLVPQIIKVSFCLLWNLDLAQLLLQMVAGALR